MIVIVCGGRDFSRAERVYSGLDKFAGHFEGIDKLIHGGAKGVDSFAGIWAKARGIKCQPYPADWENNEGRPEGDAPPFSKMKQGNHGLYDIFAGLTRNQQMLDVEKPDYVIAFKGRQGTRDMITRARKAGVPVWHAHSM